VSTAVAAKRPSKARYSEEEIRSCLLQVAVEDGNRSSAQAELRKKGLKVSRHTLARWCDHDYADLYLSIRDEVQNVRQRKHAAEMEDSVSRGIEITKRYWERADQVLDELPARDVSTGLRNLGVTLGIQVQRTLELREKPVMMPKESRTADEIIRALEAKKVIKQIDATVNKTLDIPDAEVVPDPKEGAA
jgi:hypothetical protein